MNRSKAGARLRLLTVFIAVVDARGFAAAARRLGVSPATVTRAIAELELHLGARVLSKTTRSIRLTEAGSRYAEDCRQILYRLNQAEADVKGLPQIPQGHLTIAAPMSLSNRPVTPIVAEYLRRYPQAGATCLFFDREVSVIDEGVDVILRIGPTTDLALQAVRVGVLRHVICASPSYLRRQPAPREPSHLQEHHIIGGPSADVHVEWQLGQRGETRTTRLVPRLMTNSPEAAVQLAVDGIGLAQLNLALVHDLLVTGRLVTVLDEFEPTPAPVSLLHREGRYASTKARAFMDIAVESLRRDPGLRPPPPERASASSYRAELQRR